MKTINESKTGRHPMLMLSIAALLVLPAFANAQEKGAEKLMKLNRVATPADIQAVQPGDTVVMSCPKCKDIWVTVVERTFKAANPQEKHLVKQHQCPGCGSEKVTQGHGKAKTTQIVHVCKACGSKDANCSVMKKGQTTTPGMEQK